ncbi:early transcribed membrane protein [Plasmodium vinckei brucechwatti]|uniref:Early transcribed membrane protein n=1 Tax=Plasmodium vinckei brucechwatti TaxID=119398 RepID=A0A6V7RYN2_PLAVN|nr:early transcribed membrane protein [Plasmodium vinckei brucechwatti]
MKLAKALYFFAFLLAINVLVPGSNNYVEAKSKKVTKGGNGFIRKIKNNKAAFLSTLAATIALAIGTTFGVMHLQKKKGNKKPSGSAPVKSAPVKSTPPKTPSVAPENKSAPETETKPSTPEINTRSQSPYNPPSRAYPPASH